MTFRPIRDALRAPVRIAAAALLVVAGATLGGSPAGAATAPDCGPKIKKNLFVSWKCTFADDFNGTSLDTTKWTPVTTASNGVTGGDACFVDSPENISVHDGALHLTVRQAASPFTCHSPKGDFTTQYATGQVATYGRFFQTYGRISVRAAFPAATVAGLQSTLWLWPEDPTSIGAVGEIDFAEWYSNYADYNIPYVHYLYDPSTTNLSTHVNVVTTYGCVIGDASAFHEYVAEWNSSSVVIKVDGKTCLTDRYLAWGTNPFAQPFFAALSQALGVGANAPTPGTPLPATTTVDWVRIWK